MKVFILIVIGMVQGHPVATPVSTFETAKQCQDYFVVFAGAAFAKGLPLAGACLSYQLPGKES